MVQYPVEEITIAGNLREMSHQTVAIGADVLMRGTKETGPILVGQVTVAGGQIVPTEIKKRTRN